jgi:ferrous iron transport protein A
MSLFPTVEKPRLLPLCQLSKGAVGTVCELGGTHSMNLRLRELGFSESARVKKISGRSTVICDVCGTRLALSHDLARTILVQPLVAAV